MPSVRPVPFAAAVTFTIAGLALVLVAAFEPTSGIVPFQAGASAQPILAFLMGLGLVFAGALLAPFATRGA